MFLVLWPAVTPPFCTGSGCAGDGGRDRERKRGRWKAKSELRLGCLPINLLLLTTTSVMKCKQHQSQILSPPWSAPPPPPPLTGALFHSSALTVLGYSFWCCCCCCCLACLVSGLVCLHSEANPSTRLNPATNATSPRPWTWSGERGMGESEVREHYPLWRAGIIKINELTFTCRSIWPQKRNKCTTDLLFWMLICRGGCRLRRGRGAAVKDQEHPPYVHIHLITGMSSPCLLWSIANLLFMWMIFPFVFPTFFSLFSPSFFFSLFRAVWH